jgi:hypothetical protein
VTCFAEAGGQHVPAMARAVEELGIRACLTRSTMDTGEGLPPAWAAETTKSCLQVKHDCTDTSLSVSLEFLLMSPDLDFGCGMYETSGSGTAF